MYIVKMIAIISKWKIDTYRCEIMADHSSLQVTWATILLFSYGYEAKPIVHSIAILLMIERDKDYFPIQRSREKEKRRCRERQIVEYLTIHKSVHMTIGGFSYFPSFCRCQIESYRFVLKTREDLLNFHYYFSAMKRTW